MPVQEKLYVVDSLSEVVPIALELPTPLRMKHRRHDAFECWEIENPNDPAVAEYKRYISEISAVGMPANLLGKFATGLARGRIDTSKGSQPLGLYRVSTDGVYLEFLKPEHLRENWGAHEQGISPVLQIAMCNMFDYADY